MGTVQFGMRYGINNKFGKPTKEETFEMLDIAREKGISIFDTAAAYGDAEEILGSYVSQRKLKETFRVITKLRPNLIEDETRNPQGIVEEEIKSSLKRLNVDTLDGYLLHTPKNFYNKGIMEGLQYCKEIGLVKNIGVSIYEVEHALDVVSSREVDYIQIPYSVFDQRIDKTNFFEIAKKNKVKVHARSAFLQGLIFMSEEEIPNFLEDAKQYLRKYDEIIRKYELTRLEAAMLFSYNNDNIDYFVFGVDNKVQLLEDIDVIQKRVNCQEYLSEIKRSFINIKKSIIFPSLWARKN